MRLALVIATLALGACSGQDPLLGVEGPRSGGLVFVRKVDGRSDLARARLSDGAVVSVRRTPAREERWPYWSDAAGRVAFQSRAYDSANLRTDVHLWDPVSGEEVALTSKPERDDRWPTWSPVTRHLVYAFKQARRPSGLAYYDLESGETTLLAVTGPSDFYLRPAFSPDGRRLVAQRRTGDGSGTSLWILEPGRTPQPLPSVPDAVDTKARFTRDGSRIIFSRQVTKGGRRRLLRLDPATSVVEPIASHPESDDHSAWPSPTRDEISFISDRDGGRDVFLLEEGGTPRNLTRSPEWDEGAPIWSPDGELLVVLRVPVGDGTEGKRDRGALRLLVIDRQGRARFETQGQMADWMPAWPDPAAAQPTQ
jgi:Tol biopolymer transport system component